MHISKRKKKHQQKVKKIAKRFTYGAYNDTQRAKMQNVVKWINARMGDARLNNNKYWIIINIYILAGWMVEKNVCSGLNLLLHKFKYAVM